MLVGKYLFIMVEMSDFDFIRQLIYPQYKTYFFGVFLLRKHQQQILIGVFLSYSIEFVSTIVECPMNRSIVQMSIEN